MTVNAYYVHSGRISWKSLLKPLLTGLPLVILLAALYALVIRYNPFAYISFIATALLGAMTGIIATTSAQSALSRSRLFNTVMGVCFGAVALWVQWLLWLRMSTDQTWMEITHFAFGGPDVWFNYLGALSRQWHMSISRSGVNDARLSPVMQECIWWAEAIAIVFISGLTAAVSGENDAFNERTGQWAKKKIEAELIADSATAAEWRARVEATGIVSLLELQPAACREAPAASTWRTLQIRCLSDHADADFCLIKLDRLTHIRTENGKIKVRSECVSKLRLVDNESFQALVQHLQSTVEVSDEVGPNDASKTSSNPPELIPAIDAFQASRYDVALALSLPHLAAAQVPLQNDAHRMCGLACARLGRWHEAYSYFQVLFEREESAQNALQLGTTAIMSGQVKPGKTWFERACQLNLESREIPEPILHSSYATACEEAGIPAEARSSVEWFKTTYIGLPNTDPTYLHLHHMPLFSVFLEKSLPVLRACLNQKQIISWYQGMREYLDDDGKAMLDRHLVLLQSPAANS